MAGRTVWIAALASLLAGCYTYVPSSLSEVTPEQDVRLRLGALEAARLEEFAGNGARVLDGRILSQDGDSLLVRVESHSELRGVRVETLYQRIHVARPAVVDVELRELDKGRTYLLTGAAVAAVALIAVDRLQGGGSETPPNGGTPNEALIPMLRLRLPVHVLSLFGR